MQEKHLSRVSLDLCQGGRDRKYVYSRKTEDYMADFCLVSRRNLDEFDYKVFRFHFLLGADWRLCCRRMKIDRGTFFHAVYRVEQKLGRIFRELEPYGLYPLDEYFCGKIEKGQTPGGDNVKVMPIRGAAPLRAPIRKSA